MGYLEEKAMSMSLHLTLPTECIVNSDVFFLAPSEGEEGCLMCVDTFENGTGIRGKRIK
jgi:hypothetical protein